MAVSSDTMRQRALAPIESAVKAYLSSLGAMIDDASVNQASQQLMGKLSPAVLRSIALSGSASNSQLAALVPQAVQSSQSGKPVNLSALAINASAAGTCTALAAQGLTWASIAGAGGYRASSESGNSPSSYSRAQSLADSANSGLSSLQQVNMLGRMSGTDFAVRLGFQGEEGRLLGGMLANTSGAFRQQVDNYKHVMDDPNATDEQKREAAKKMRGAAKTKRERDAADALEKAIKKMKHDGVNLSDQEAQHAYTDSHGDVHKALATDEAQKTAVRSAMTTQQAQNEIQKATKEASVKPKPNTGSPERRVASAPLVTSKL